MQPFLKWPGGKRWFVSKYGDIFPREYNEYFEPFVGGGSVFFHLLPKQATISDINEDLINTYRVMAKKPNELRKLLEEHQNKHNVEYYYNIRKNIPIEPIERAARFIYLNRTCFNGMYRVNKFGIFNVPIGTKNFFIDDVEDFEEYSKVLKNVHMRSQDFVKIIHQAGYGDLIFADPPYTTQQNQNTFIKYNDKLFSWEDQCRLLKALVKARDRGSIIISTNAFHDDLVGMYKENGFYIQNLSRFSSISGTLEGRGNKKELLITSYPTDFLF